MGKFQRRQLQFSRRGENLCIKSKAHVRISFHILLSIYNPSEENNLSVYSTKFDMEAFEEGGGLLKSSISYMEETCSIQEIRI